MGNSILYFFLVLLLLLVAKLVLWGTPIVDMIHDWKQSGKLPTSATIPKEMPIECLDSKQMSMACANHSSIKRNEYLVPEKMSFC